MEKGHRLRIGVIGAGTAGGRHAAAYQKLTDAELVAIVDPEPTRGEALAKESGARYFQETTDSFWKSVDAVSVCPPHNLLAACALAAIDHRKAVLLEKPMALTLPDAEAVTTAAQQADVPLMVGFVHRFRAEAQAARQAIVEGAIGTPIFAVEHLIAGAGPTPGWIWRRELAGGGVVLYNGIHGIDRLRWLIGREVIQVFANSATASHAADVEDVLVATLLFEGGVSASFVQHIAAYPLPPGWRSEIYGTGGALLLGPESSLTQSTAWRTTTLRAERDDRFLAETTEFVAAVRDGRQPSVTGADGRAALAIALALYESAATGQPAAPAHTPNAPADADRGCREAHRPGD
jgi:predicted dehydrogenase